MSVLLLLGISAAAVPHAAAGETRAGRQRAARKSTAGGGLALLEEVIAEAPSLRLAENRALVQATAADLLWPSDEQRARALFAEAVAGLGRLADTTPRDEAERESLLNAHCKVWQLTLQLLARHDPRAARALLRADGRPRLGPGEELHFEIGLARQILTSDADQAAGLAAETLQRGFSGELTELIVRLKSRDPTAAAGLAKSAASKLQTSNLSASEEAARVALDLLRLGSASAGSRAPLLDEQSLRALAEVLTAESTSNPDDNALLLALEPLLPQLERYAPARAPLVIRRLRELNGAAGEAGPDDEVVGAGREVREEEERRAPAAPSPAEERAGTLIELAKESARREEKGRAIELLEEAYALVGGRARNFAQLCAQLKVADAFAPLDSERSLSIVESAVDRVNELADALATADGFLADGRMARDGELVLEAVAGYVSAFPEEDAEGLALLADTRFDRVLLVADRLQRNELRAAARLLVLRRVLARPGVADEPRGFTRAARYLAPVRRTPRQSPD